MTVTESDAKRRRRERAAATDDFMRALLPKGADLSFPGHGWYIVHAPDGDMVALSIVACEWRYDNRRRRYHGRDAVTRLIVDAFAKVGLQPKTKRKPAVATESVAAPAPEQPLSWPPGVLV